MGYRQRLRKQTEERFENAKKKKQTSKESKIMNIYRENHDYKVKNVQLTFAQIKH